jgi:GTP cyclohydrolase I
MEAAMAELLGEAGIEVGQPGVQASIRRYVLSLLAATSGYHQELLVGPTTSSSSGSSSSRAGGAAEGGWGSLDGLPVGGCPCCSGSRLGPAAGRLPAASSSGLCGCPTYSSQEPSTSNQQQQQGAGEVEQHHLPFISQCEHHMLPFYGTVHVALLTSPAQQHQEQQQQQQRQDTASTTSSRSSSAANCGDPGVLTAAGTAAAAAERELRAAQVAHIVSAYTQRLQVQERITQQVAEAVQRLLGAGDVMVVVRAAHMCMVARGVENHAGTTVTRVMTGKFASDALLRANFLRAVSKQGGGGQQ